MIEHALIDQTRRRSLGFLEQNGKEWACFLITFRSSSGRWYGNVTFRPRDSEGDMDEIRTADIFMESSESEIDRKARGLGKPLLRALFSSALDTQQRTEAPSPRLRKWFRNMLSENSQEIATTAKNHFDDTSDHNSVAELQSLYASYKIDQVCHFIALLKPDDFEIAVDRILEGQPVDFGVKDQIQLAMIVVEYIEARIPIPTFEVWTTDFLANREEYLLYAHTLHHEGRLP